MSVDAQEPLYISQPVTRLGDIPPSWWDEVLDGRPFLIDLLSFVSSDPFAIRTLAYRRAASRRRYVKVSVDLGNAILYLQAYQQKGQILTGFKWNAHPVPPVPAMRVRNPAVRVLPVPDRGPVTRAPMPTVRQQRSACTCGTSDFRMHEEHCELLAPLRARWQEQRDRETAAAAVAPPPPAPQSSPEVPVGWIRSKYTGCLLPPGVPDIEGAFYEDGLSAQEIADLAREYEDFMVRCTCGAPDLRFHEPSCAVAGG